MQAPPRRERTPTRVDTLPSHTPHSRHPASTRTPPQSRPVGCHHVFPNALPPCQPGARTQHQLPTPTSHSNAPPSPATPATRIPGAPQRAASPQPSSVRLPASSAAPHRSTRQSAFEPRQKQASPTHPGVPDVHTRGAHPCPRGASSRVPWSISSLLSSVPSCRSSASQMRTAILPFPCISTL